MSYWELFLAFFIPSIVGYGGGPATIPLIKHEVVDNYGMMTVTQFSETLAIGNALPGPIATKLAAYIGYHEGGIIGAIIATFATVGPSLLLMMALLGLLQRYKSNPRVKRLSMFVLPAIAILMFTTTWDFVKTSVDAISWLPTIVLMVASYLALERFKIHPALVILVGLCIGGFFL